MWNVALLTRLTSELQLRHRARPQSCPGVYGQMECELWVRKRGEVLMRHPPSAGCLFGQTSCLTAQAVDGILMDMTNDSLSPFSWFLPTRLPSHSPFRCMCMKLKKLTSQGFKLHNSFITQGTAVTSAHILESFGLGIEHTPTFIITYWWVDIKPSLVFAVRVGLSNPLLIHHRCSSFQIMLRLECCASREEQEEMLHQARLEPAEI